MAAERPGRVVVVVGTGTEVGKTWVAARLLAGLRARGVTAAARKPVQSAGADEDPASGDAAVLSRATGEPEDAVCPPAHRYGLAMAPPMAAEASGRSPLRLDDLCAVLSWAQGGATPDVGLVETAGGVRSPQAADGDGVDLVARLEPDLLVLVADPGLGTINAVRLTAEALTGPGDLPPEGIVIVLNHFNAHDELHRRNRDWLVGRYGFRVLVTPGDESSLADAAMAPDLATGD